MNIKIFRSTVDGFGRGRFLIASDGRTLKALRDYYMEWMNPFPIGSLNMRVAIELKVKRVL